MKELNPNELAVVLKHVGNFDSKIFRQGADVTKVFKIFIVSN